MPRGNGVVVVVAVDVESVVEVVLENAHAENAPLL
jgi:hypothetical protein